MQFASFRFAVLLLTIVGTPCVRFLDNDARQAPNYPVAGIVPNIREMNVSINKSSALHSDNFGEEVIDQADPEFDMIAGDDDCINMTDAEAPYKQGFQRNAMGRSIWTEEEKKNAEDAESTVLENIRIQFAHADSNGDGCVNRTEFRVAAEMEGPPPGFEAIKVMRIGAENFTKELEAEDRLEFDTMDRNHDGKVSMSEAYHFAGENMPQADIDEQILKEIFEEADFDGDKFLSFEEFVRAGQGYHGDGNETAEAKPIWPTSLLATVRHEVLLGLIKTKSMHRHALKTKRH